MKVMYLNFDKLTLSQFFSMIFDGKLKKNWYYEQNKLILWKNIHIFLSLHSFSVLA